MMDFQAESNALADEFQQLGDAFAAIGDQTRQGILTTLIRAGSSGCLCRSISA